MASSMFLFAQNLNYQKLYMVTIFFCDVLLLSRKCSKDMAVQDSNKFSIDLMASALSYYIYIYISVKGS